MNPRSSTDHALFSHESRSPAGRRSVRRASLLGGRRGAAIVETAILCLFLYAPILMMVIIWGDMNLDKERAHAATSYMAFAGRPLDNASLVEQFFPDAMGLSDATLSVRSVAVEADDENEGPFYSLLSGASDYGGRPPEFDLQYKLYSLAAGEVHVTYELQAMPDGTVGFVAQINRIEDEVARYLTQKGRYSADPIVNIGPVPGGSFTVPVGEELNIETGGASTVYTPYVETLTDIFNGRWDAGGERVGGIIGNAAPTMESRAGIRTLFKSPFLLELEQPLRGGRADVSESLNLPRVAGEPAFEMHFGATQFVPEDDSFRGGYTYLRNPMARLDAERLRSDLYELSPRVFNYQGHKIYEMVEPLSSERGEQDRRFLEPGDAR
jgi:hypothetical protein